MYLLINHFLSILNFFVILGEGKGGEGEGVEGYGRRVVCKSLSKKMAILCNMQVVVCVCFGGCMMMKYIIITLRTQIRFPFLV